jgi:hypothetical protein
LVQRLWDVVVSPAIRVFDRTMSVNPSSLLAIQWVAMYVNIELRAALRPNELNRNPESKSVLGLQRQVIR